jgi:6-pyruvoyltetrahydropterin/6-carboxytetrahydropterin synthase
MKRVIKTYGHERGLSATFRQWRAKSHCRFLHGYALAFTFVFECADEDVDENGWVIDFGGLKPVKQLLDDTFDHRTIVAANDPSLRLFRDMANDAPSSIRPGGKLVDLVVLPAVGCEAFAEWVYNKVTCMLAAGELGATNARLISVECREHGSNAAIYMGATEYRTVLEIDGSKVGNQIAEAIARIQEAQGQVP